MAVVRSEPAGNDPTHSAAACAWLALFADDVVYEDPPGTVASRWA